ncbi:MAG: hydroxypyruvate isomerase family protein [Planctomycetota bacterium]
MATLSVCLETVFVDLPPLERIEKIRACGYGAVEFWHPEGTWDGRRIRTDLPKDPRALREACLRHGVALADFAFHAWDGSLGGCPVRREDRARFLDQVRRMVSFARESGAAQGIVLSGTVDSGLSRSEMRRNLEEALAEAAALAGPQGVTLLLEPLNAIVDHPGYYLTSTREGLEIIRSVGSPHLKLLYDVYHMQIMEGNLLGTIEAAIDRIGHFHAAGVPGRGELFRGEIDYPNVLRRIEALGYQGAFGLEYFPAIPDHAESLRKTLEYLRD